MTEIEIGVATLSEINTIAAMDMSFETGAVWSSRTDDNWDSYSITLQRITLPKTITVPFQALPGPNLEMMVMREEVLSVRYEGQCIGYIRLEQEEGISRLVLRTGGITKSYRNKGIGSVLLHRVEEIAKRNGIHEIQVIVQAKNDAAIRFLTANGFHFAGCQEFYFPNMEIGVFFVK